MSLLPSDFLDAPSLLLAKCDTKVLGVSVLKKVEVGVNIGNPDVQAQVLCDASHALMDFPNVFRPSKLQMRYAQVIGRLLILAIGFLPDHGFSPEETAVQLLLLGVSIKPIIRSIKLYRCISSANCLSECELELDELESSLP